MSLNWSEASKGINFRILWDTTSWNSQRALRWQGIYSLFVALLSEFYLVISYYILLATISPIHQCCSARGNFLQRLYWFLVLISVRLDLSLRICYHTAFRSCAYILSFPTKWYTHPWDLVSSPSSLLGSRGTKRENAVVVIRPPDVKQKDQKQHQICFPEKNRNFHFVCFCPCNTIQKKEKMKSCRSIYVDMLGEVHCMHK